MSEGKGKRKGIYVYVRMKAGKQGVRERTEDRKRKQEKREIK